MVSHCPGGGHRSSVEMVTMGVHGVQRVCCCCEGGSVHGYAVVHCSSPHPPQVATELSSEALRTPPAEAASDRERSSAQQQLRETQQRP